MLKIWSIYPSLRRIFEAAYWSSIQRRRSLNTSDSFLACGVNRDITAKSKAAGYTEWSLKVNIYSILHSPGAGVVVSIVFTHVFRNAKDVNLDSMHSDRVVGEEMSTLKILSGEED